NLNQFFEWFKKAPKEITNETMNEYKNYIENKFSPSTVWLRFIALNSFLKYAIGTKRTSEILSFKRLKLIPPKKDKGYYQVLQEHEIDSLLNQPDTMTLMGKRDYAILRLMCTYGLRANEICKIKYDDFEDYRVKDQQKLWIKDRKGKAGNRANTAIILNGKVLHAIDDWISSVGIKTDNDTPLFNQFKWNMSRALLELDKNRINAKMMLSVRTIENIIERYTNQASIKTRFKISPHALRHSALTLLAKEGVQLIDLKYLAG
ncbi:integrase family protein, partial [Candidatus Magnetomorum sp. HK-1]